MKRSLSAALICVVLTFAQPAAAAEWEQVGTQQADFKRDTDVIIVQGSERHRRIRLCVEQAPLRMRDLRVMFANGATQDVRVRQRFAPGSCTRAIDLRGQRRNVSRISMTYDKVGGGPPAVVKVYAR